MSSALNTSGLTPSAILGRSSSTAQLAGSGLPLQGTHSQATSFVKKEVDNELKEKLEASIQDYVYLFKKTGRRRQAYVLSTPIIYASGSALQSNDSSLTHLGGMSAAGADVLNHLEKIIQKTEIPKTEYGYDKYLDTLDDIPIHCFNDDECTKFPGPWDLITSAAIASKKIYSDKEIGSNGRIITPGPDVVASGNTKAFSVYSDMIDGKHVLIVTIRGTVTKLDWFVNFNGGPRLSSTKEVLEATSYFHSGFLVTALAMQSKVYDLIISEVERIAGRYDSILFTGHSAGGGIAQLFYAMANTPGTPINLATSQIPKKHCVTFAAPPIASDRIPHKGSGEFINVINEGDPVGLAQKAYIEALLDVFVLTETELEKQYGGSFKVPPPIMKASAEKIIILRDLNPDDTKSKAIEASLVDAEVLEKKLFGNVLVHPMDEYLRRLKRLAGDHFLQGDGLEERRTSITLYESDQELVEVNGEKIKEV